ncbi:DUF421 domain-containing protein [Peribacillus asahii]|uniref:DUF421 domain-containing protein n=1 Tax=Peribacillus asahii TaxID=228899 RepID=UPI003825FC27
MEELLHPMLRTVISYIILLFVTYLFGKRMNSQLNYHSFAVAITIGSFIANMGFDTNLKFWPILTSFFILTFVFYLSSYLSYQNKFLYKYLSGQPTAIIEKGKINEINMKKAKYCLYDLQQQLRENGVFQIEEIETAYLEVSGKLSIQLKEQYKPATKQYIDQLNMKRPVELIIDGKILKENLTSTYNQEWLHMQCQSRNVRIEQVSYAVVGTNGVFYTLS